MEIKEALKTLDQMCAEINTNRQGHVILQQAMQVVTEATKLSAPVTLGSEKKKKKESDGNK